MMQPLFNHPQPSHPMHLAQHSSVCLSHNAFRPATVLWQQFVLPNRSFLSHQRYSTASLSQAQNLPSQTADDQQVKYPPPESISSANKRQIDDINPDDLSATLESHRVSNRATLIRRQHIRDSEGPDIRRPVRVPDSPRFKIRPNAEELALDASRTRTDGTSSRASVVKASGGIFEHVKAKPGGPGAKSAESGPETNQTSDNVDPMLAAEGSKANLKERDRRKLHPRSYTSKTFKRTIGVLEYEGQNVLPIVRTVVLDSALPWTIPFDSRSMSGPERLSLEISAFHSYMIPTPKEQAGRENVIRQLKALASEILPGYQYEVFGSERTGLALAVSDIDLRLYSEPSETDRDTLPEMAPRHRVRKQMTKKLAKLHNGLQKSGHYILCTLRHARYPLITLQHKESGLDIQIVSSNDTSISRLYVKKYLEEYHGLRELFTTLKVMFDVRGLSDVFRGGLGSYSIFMMAVASLRHAPHTRSNDLSQQLMAFLNFWSAFDTYNLGVSIEPAETFAKNSKRIATTAQLKKLEELSSIQQSWFDIGQIDPAQPYLLCLQDPADATNDLGKKGFGIKHVQATFQAIEKELKKNIQDNRKTSLLAPLVGCSYALFKDRREKLENYGETSQHPEAAE